MHEYARWKYVALIVAAVVGTVYALPSVYGDQPSVQISARSGDPLPADFGGKVDPPLAEARLQPEASSAEKDKWLVRFNDEVSQLKAAEALKRALGSDYVVALNLAPKTPAWLAAIGARPMSRGLDLRGGVHFLMEVDAGDVRARAIGRYLNDLPALLRSKDVRYTARRQQGEALVLEFADAAHVAQAQKEIAKEHAELTLTPQPEATPPALRAQLSDPEVKRIVDFAVSQNITTLRNRVNELGVAEPLVQRQGATRILVQLPGVQDTTRVKDLLGATATLEYRAVDLEADPRAAVQSGIVPAGDELFFTREGHRPYLLRKEPIVTGDQLVDADSTFDQQSGGPAVAVSLDAVGAKRMLAFTEKNVGKPMAVLFKETVNDTKYNAAGEAIREKHEVEDIINVATIRGVFGKRFITTGVSSKEARELSILLRAGALAAPIAIVEERTVGPSLGADNIKRGFEAAAGGLTLVVIFMVLYYRVFGMFAVAALLLNLVLVVAELSLIHATLTMPGIAGIVLTMGIAVDANVLIYERIREELRNGNSPHAAIQAGYDRAFLTIADANITVLIGTVVLFALGAGPVKGFAVTLALGIITSQFTAIIGSRALAQLVFARRKLKDVPIW